MVRADYYDGRSARRRAVTVSASGTELQVVGEDVDLRVAFADVAVDERLGRAPRRLRFAEGVCEIRDLDGLDALLASLGHRDGWLDRAQRRWSYVSSALVACACLTVAMYVWGLPWLAARVAEHLPTSVGAALSVQTLKLLDGSLLVPSTLDRGRQTTLDEKLHRLRLPAAGRMPVLLFRGSPQLGANAFTLPDGTIVVTDDLVLALKADDEILAVLAHEVGHGAGKHGVQLLLRSSLVGAFSTLYFGDISGLLAVAPAALVQARYSRDLERQADDYAAALLRANGLSPALLADALDTLSRAHPGQALDGYLASHPPTAERIRRLRHGKSL